MGNEMGMTTRLLGVAAAAAAVLLLALVFFPPAWPWQRTFQFSLAAQPFGQLNSDATVELGGIKVGKVQGLDLVNGQGLVRLQVDRQYANLLHADTSATIRPHGLLGPEYVDLNGGSSGSLREGAIVPSSRVRVATDVDQVLNSLQPDVRQNLQTLIRELGTASEGRGQDLNDSLKALGNASADLTTVTGTLHAHDADLQSIIDLSERLNRDLQYAPVDAQIRDTNKVLSGLAEVNGSIGGGVDHTAAVLAALDVILEGNSQNLSYTLGKAPDLVNRLRALLAEFTTILTAVNPSLPALMTAVVETKSAFGGHDANGNFVRIQAILGSCIAGININCAGGPSAGGPPVTVPGTTPPGGVQVPQPSSSAATTPGPRMSDQDLIGLLRGFS
jgi:ABC-type transporter Mla subunit MlaD